MSFRVLALGSNGSGQLGVDHSEDVWEPELCRFQPEPGHTSQVDRITAGGNHTLVLTSDGLVWAAGNNSDGRCGVDNEPEQLSVFHQVDVQRVTSVAATWEASIFVIDKRLVFSCGTGAKGELGQGPSILESQTLTQIPMPDELLDKDTEISDVVTGVNHVVLLTSTGELIGWGGARKGQLGNDARAEKIVWEPRKIDLPFIAHKVVAGRDFTFILGIRGEQLMLGDWKESASAWSIPSGGQFQFITAGWSHVYHLSQSNLYSLGQSHRGQLPPATLPNLKCFAAGSEHCIACTDGDNEIIAWGWGEHGNCGRPLDARGCVADRWNTILISNKGTEAIQQVGAGCATSFMVVGSG